MAQRYDLYVIEAAHKKAQEALNQEQWDVAAAAYDEILALDPNIQFALDGLAAAKAHKRVTTILREIIKAPTRLSSQALFLEAQDVLNQGQKLSLAGPELAGRLKEVERILNLYSDPVELILLSDNATDITISNVGRIGVFEEKKLIVRPGQYTIRGSQSGCRDLFMSVEVIPGIQPLDLSCPERL